MYAESEVIDISSKQAIEQGIQKMKYPYCSKRKHGEPWNKICVDDNCDQKT